MFDLHPMRYGWTKRKMRSTYNVYDFKLVVTSTHILPNIPYKLNPAKHICMHTKEIYQYAHTQWSWIHTRTQALFYRFVACAFPFFEVKSVLPIDRYQNATSKAISLGELKKVQLQERYTLLTQDSIGHLKTLCMSVLSLVVALESEWKRDSSSQSNKKTLAF